jgi:L-alanine-DL-glutamate epimerase-like enolase superfamily enzyme
VRPAIPVERVEASAYTVPTDAPEADGTFAWDDTTLVLVQVTGGGQIGTGWTYGSLVTATLVKTTLAPLLEGRIFDGVSDAWTEQVCALRNIGRPGIGSMALSAVDCALWDLAARLAGAPLHEFLGAATSTVPLYGSGGFTSYDSRQLDTQLNEWLADGFQRVKIKIGEGWGTNAPRDLQRVGQTRDTVGPDVEVFVDANGGYTREVATRLAPALAELDVRWFEEPVSSDDLTGLASVRRTFRSDVAAGEYGYDLAYFRHLLDAEAVDCVQVDVTRCGGITELLRIADLAGERGLDVSGHCAPYQHAPVLAAVGNLRHLEWFHDHVRIEERMFERAAVMAHGALQLDSAAAGNGLVWQPAAAAPFRVL